MRIVIDHVTGDDGCDCGVIAVHTDAAPWNTCADPTAKGVQIPMLTWLSKLKTGAIPIAGTGYEVMSNHPAYPGKTRQEVLHAEIVRLNDAAARTALGL